tara:strand:+ start:5452 stop:5625 length:174 start_codon:yes stop_codon:yes gene_type:complete
MMSENGFTMGSVRRIAKQLVDVSDKKRKQVLSNLPSEMRCRVVERMVEIRIIEGRNK